MTYGISLVTKYQIMDVFGIRFHDSLHVGLKFVRIRLNARSNILKHQHYMKIILIKYLHILRLKLITGVILPLFRNQLENNQLQRRIHFITFSIVRSDHIVNITI